MIRYLLYSVGFALSLVMVFLAVYGLLSFLRLPDAKEASLADEQKQMEAYYGVLDSLEAVATIRNDSTTAELDEEVLGSYSLDNIDSLFVFLQNPTAYVSRYRPRPEPALDSVAIQAKIDQEVARREEVIDTLQAEIGRLKKSVTERSAEAALTTSATEYKKLAKIYEGMEPENAAHIFTSLGDQMAAAVLGQMKKRQAAEILAALSPEQAARLSNLILQAN